MSEETKRKLKEEGINVLVVDKIYVFLLILAMFLSIGIAWGTTSNRIDNVEKVVITHGDWIEEHKEEDKEFKILNVKSLERIESYLQQICDKNNINYRIQE